MKESYETPKVLSIVDYKPSPGIVIPGISETVPNEALSLRELVKKAQFMAYLPDLAKCMEEGPDDDFDDDLPDEVDLADYSDNSAYIGRYSEKIAEIKQKRQKEKESKESEEEGHSES